MRVLLSVLLLSTSPASASTQFDSLSKTLAYPAGTSISPDGTIVYDPKFYEVKATQFGHSVQNKNDRSQMILVNEENGTITHLVTKGGNRLSIVALGKDGPRSASDCGKVTINGEDSQFYCTTTNRQMCDKIQKATQAHSLKEAKAKIDSCKDLILLPSDPDFKAIGSKTLATEKANLQKAAQMTTDGGQIPYSSSLERFMENDPVMGYSNLIYFFQAAAACTSATFTQDPGPSAIPARFKPAATQ